MFGRKSKKLEKCGGKCKNVEASTESTKSSAKASCKTKNCK